MDLACDAPVQDTSAARFAAVLRAHRLAAAMTQREVATRAGVGVRTIRELEHARVYRPRRSTVALIAEVLGLTGRTREAFFATIYPE